MPVILKKIKYKIKDVSVRFLIKLSLFLNWPDLAALALWLAAKTMNPKCRGNYTVLGMGRSVFIDDIRAMMTYSGRIKYIVIWRTYFQIIFYYFIKGSEAEKLTEENYHTHDFCKQGKKNYYLFLKKMFPRLRKLINFDAILCGNFGYPDQQEVEKVCEEDSIPYIVLHKEGLLPGDAQATRADRNLASYKFRGTAMLVYSQKVKDELLKSDFSNFSDLAENRLIVVGMPRLDEYFALAKDNKDLKKQVLFFSFHPDEKFVYLIDDKEKMKRAYERTAAFHKWVINFAFKHPEIDVKIKVKMAPHYTEYLKKIFNDNFKGDIKNLEIIHFRDAFDLIKNSTVVISHLSTTCLMAIAANKPLITPYFGDLITDREWDYFTDYPELANYAKTEEDLEKHLLNSDKYQVADLAGKNEFLEDFLGNCDGRSSLRAENAIINIIK
ncbi:MAG: hypothetical protein PHS62_00395 [Patescibacteria group bacterium]|nr:hypothetical protein [Patescibacteria group bacterium]